MTETTAFEQQAGRVSAASGVKADTDDAVGSVREYRQAHEVEILAGYADFLRLPNVAADLEDMQRNPAWIREQFGARGVALALREVDGVPLLVTGRIDVPGAERLLGIDVHYDGKPVDESRWTNAPWAPLLYTAAIHEGSEPRPFPASGEHVLQVPTLGGTLPVFLFEQILDRPAIIVPMANHDNNRHAADENIRLANLWYGIDLYAALLMMQGVGGHAAFAGALYASRHGYVSREPADLCFELVRRPELARNSGSARFCLHRARMSDQVTVWYDGGCPLCVREIALMNRLDRRDRIEFVNVDLEDASCPVDRQLLLRRMHAREGDGPLVDGAAAFAAMWRAIPVFRPLGLLAKNRAVLWVLERFYRGFLVVRPAIQRVFVAVFGTRAGKRRSGG